MDILKIHKHKNGSYLGAFDWDKIPFEVKRIFYVSSGPNKNCMRGSHAHYKCKQILVCIEGQIEIRYENKELRGKVMLFPGDTYYHKNLEWVVLDFIKENSILLSLCSEEYNEKDYIRDKSQFLDIIKPKPPRAEIVHTRRLLNIHIPKKERQQIEVRIKREMNDRDLQKAIAAANFKFGEETQATLLDISTQDIAIVGSSGTLVTQPKGAKIDDHDYVVRFNRAPIEGYEEMAGTKENLRVVNRHSFANAKVAAAYSDQSQYFIKNLRNKTICYCDPETKPLIKYYEHVHPSCDIYYVLYGYLEDVKKQLNLNLKPQFTTGLCFVCLCIISGLTPTLYGFDVGPIKPVEEIRLLKSHSSEQLYGPELTVPRTHYWEERPNAEIYARTKETPTFIKPTGNLYDKYDLDQVNRLQFWIDDNPTHPDLWNWRSTPPHGHNTLKERLILQRFAEEGLIKIG